jgi:GNAT superfamily N-acetyltransferase
VIRPATLADLPAIRDLLSSANDSPYDASAVAEEKCFGAGYSGHATPLVAMDGGRLAGVAVGCGRYLRLICVERDSRRRGIGTALLRALKPEVIASEAGNYFTPGLVDSDEASNAFFAKHAYRQSAETWNLHAPLSGGQTILSVRSDIRTDRIVCPPQLLEFIGKHFGRVWAFEAARAHATVWIENAGFAAVEANNRGLGTFGPTAVIETMRGRGFGREILLAALAQLRDFGFSRAIIPWTDAIAFYAKSCGAETAHRFVTYTSRP